MNLMIGHFATFDDVNDGQTVKTRNLYNELKKEGKEIQTIDTQCWKKRKYRFFKEIVKSFFKSKKIVLVVASNGAKILVPLLVFLKKFHKVQIYYCAVGSWLDVRIDKNIILRHCCKKIDTIFVETEELKSNLSIKGYNNVKKMYNFKNFNSIVTDNKSNYEYKHFCTFSRVMKEKGIEDAIYAINELNCTEEEKIYLDIYGPIEKSYEQDFKKLINNQNGYIRYIGNINPEDSIKYISKYYMLLFPTRYIKEGLPGTIIDSYNAGVPIISSNWNSAEEFVKNNETGLIYEFGNKEELKKKILYAIENKERIENMREKAKEFSYFFTPKEVIKPLIKLL